MLSFNIVAAAASALTLVSAAPIQQRGVPAGWATSYLEDYATYHLRYIALSCQTQHNTTFFDDCCHPLLAQEKLSSRPTYCTPNSTEIASASSAIAYSATVTASAASATTTADDEDEYCSDEASVASAVSSYVAQATGTVSVVTLTSDSQTQTIEVAAAVETSSSSKHGHSTTSSTEEAAYTPATSTEAAYTPTTTSTPAAATTTASSSSSGSGTYSGDATYYYQGGVAGECGTVHSDSDYVIAINANGFWQDYASNDNSQYCGKTVNIVRTSNGATVSAVVADVCPSCSGDYSIDLSVAAFDAIASPSEGEVAITWSFA